MEGQPRYIGTLADTFTIADVGSTLLEDLAKGIYQPHEVIREYVQNAVDAHRLYKSATGLVPSQPISIELRPNKLSIFDFGIGMDEDDIKKVKSVAVSRKRDADVILTGHKGVGIWAGLSYFGTLILQTTKLESNREYKLTIQFKNIVEAIRPEVNIGDALNPNYSIEVFECNTDDHYTIVTLEDPNQYRTPESFLEADNVQDAVRRVCPCEIDPNFVFQQNVVDWYTQKGLEAYPIEVCGRRVYKSFPSVVEDFRTDTLTVNDQVVACYWFAVHQKNAKLSPGPEQLAGFRLLQHGFALGEANPYSDPELQPYSSLPRNNYLGWHIGEVHILSPRLRPNLQRNRLEESDDTRQFVEKLREFYRFIEYQDRVLSTKRSALKRYQGHEVLLTTYSSRSVLNLSYDEQSQLVRIRKELENDDSIARTRQRSERTDAFKDTAVRDLRQRLRNEVATLTNRHSSEKENGHASVVDMQRPSAANGITTLSAASNASLTFDTEEEPTLAPFLVSVDRDDSARSDIGGNPDDALRRSSSSARSGDHSDVEGDPEPEELVEVNVEIGSVQVALVLTLLEEILNEELGRDAVRDSIVQKFTARIRWMVDLD